MLYISKRTPKYQFTMTKEISNAIPDCQDTIHFFAAERMCQVRMAYLRSPHCIYVHILNKTAELKALELDLQSSTAGLDKISEVERVVVGQPVIFSGMDQTTKEAKSYRAVVLDVEDSNAQVKDLLNNVGFN